METDLHLLSRYHRHGDAGAFQALVKSHAGMVHATAARVTRDAMLAQDVAQETFLALARGGGAAIRSVGAWLHHVAWQKARDVVRGESRRRNYEAAAAGEMQQADADTTWAELEPLLDEALEELPAGTKSVLIERFFEGRTQQEIAQQHGISQSTVSRTVEEGIGQLRARLKARGVACGAGLVTLLTTHGVQAATPALVASLGKIALSGVGVGAASLTATQLITSLLMAPAAKVMLTAAAVLAAAALGTHMASRNFSAPKPPAESAAVPADDPGRAAASRQSTAAARPVSSTASASAAPAATSPPIGGAGSAASLQKGVKGPSADMLARLSQNVITEVDFKAFILRAFALRDPALIAAEIERTLGLKMVGREIGSRLENPQQLEIAILSRMAARQPEETLAWMALYEGNTLLMSDVVLRHIIGNHPHLTAESVDAFLPADGPNREAILGALRAQRDPLSELAHVLSSEHGKVVRPARLYQLVNLWPKDKLSEGANWTIQNLTGPDLQATLPRLIHHLSSTAPDDAVALLAQINDPNLLAKAIQESMHGLVEEKHRMADVVHAIGRLEGKQRVTAISDLSYRWARTDQEGFIDWINNLESRADFEAAVPSSLSKLTPENYAKAMDHLMPQLDGGTLDAALIKAATPDMSRGTSITKDIIQRLTRLPRYQIIGSGQSGNADLLWEAVNRIAEGWIRRQGGSGQEGAQWIDSLNFRTPADKAAVAAKLYHQWAISDSSTAAQWAARAGVKVVQ